MMRKPKPRNGTILMRRSFQLALAGLAALLLAACAAADAARPSPGASVTGAVLRAEAAGERAIFAIPIARDGDLITVCAEYTTDGGSLSALLRDDRGQEIWRSASGPSIAIHTLVQAPRAGVYHLALAWDGAILSSYALQWQPGSAPPPSISPLALLGGIGMVVVALGFGAYAARRRLGWGYLALGALGWLVTVALKFAWAIPFNPMVSGTLVRTLPRGMDAPIFAIYVGALTGVFEVGLVALLLNYTRLGQVAWPRALAFGIGFGAIEALLLGALSIATIATAMLHPNDYMPVVLEAFAKQSDVAWWLAPVVERLATTLVHMLSCALVFYAVNARRERWFWLAFAYKSAIDAVAAFGQSSGTAALGAVWALEGIVVIFGLAGALGLRWLAPRYQALRIAPAGVDRPRLAHGV